MQRGVYWREHFQNKLDFEKSILQGRCRVHHLQLMLMRLLFIKSASPQKNRRKIRCVAMNILLLYIISLNFPLFMVEVICLYHAYRFFIFYDIPTYPSNILTPQYNWPFLKFIIYNFLMGVFPMDLICMNIRISCWKVELLAFFKSFSAWKEEKIDYF